MTLTEVAMWVGAAGFFALAGFHEWRWRWGYVRQTCGRIVSFRTETDGEGSIHYAVVEYEVDGGMRTFRSRYGSSLPPDVGDWVKVVIGKRKGEAEVYSLSNRYWGTLISVVLGALLLYAARAG